MRPRRSPDSSPPWLRLRSPCVLSPEREKRSRCPACRAADGPPPSRDWRSRRRAVEERPPGRPVGLGSRRTTIFVTFSGIVSPPSIAIGGSFYLTHPRGELREFSSDTGRVRLCG